MTGAGERASVTTRPSTQALLEEMQQASGLSKTELHNYGIDVLHFVWSVLRNNNGEIATRFTGNKSYLPVTIFIPGLIPHAKPETGAETNHSKVT